MLFNCPTSLLAITHLINFRRSGCLDRDFADRVCGILILIAENGTPSNSMPSLSDCITPSFVWVICARSRQFLLSFVFTIYIRSWERLIYYDFFLTIFHPGSRVGRGLALRCVLKFLFCLCLACLSFCSTLCFCLAVSVLASLVLSFLDIRSSCITGP